MMDRKIMFAIIIAVVVLMFSIVVIDGANIDAAAVKGQKKCVGANAAMKFIETKGCVRTYSD